MVYKPITYNWGAQPCRENDGYPLVNIQKTDGKIHPCSMGKSTISMVIFNSYVKLPEGIHGG